MLQLSHEYQITSVKVLVENALVAKESKTNKFCDDDEISRIAKLLNLSDLYELKKLKAKCLEILSTNFLKKTLESNSDFMEIDLNNRVDIYRKQIDILEKKLRDIIYERMGKKDPEYWELRKRFCPN